MKIWMIPLKGKGHERTALNTALKAESDLAKPLTTDPADNAILIEEDGETLPDALCDAL